MEMIALVAEVLSLVVLVAAAICAVIWAIVRVARGGWREVSAEESDGELRWMTDDGEFFSIPSGEFTAPDSGDGPTVFYRVNVPDVPHEEPIAHDERTLRTLAIVLGAVGIIATAASFVAALTG